MEAVVTRADELEVASFIDRIALFITAGCNPQQALDYCLSSMPDDSPLREECLAILDTAKPGQSPAETLRQAARRLDSEALMLVGMGFEAYLKLGVDLKGPLARLAEVIRWHHATPIHPDAKYEREVAVALFGHKMDFLTEIDKTPKDALEILAANDQQLGQELVRIQQDLAVGYSLSEAFGPGCRADRKQGAEAAVHRDRGKFRNGRTARRYVAPDGRSDKERTGRLTYHSISS
ncbi:MAG TPA: hypothetical protein VHS28_08155 [Chloroflexota bacterium]|nr:hypothetical protein [Chloroflexota bacterium]